MASDREMEKQLIRDQMLAEEIARRRILQDGVRRELMIGCSSRFSPFLGLEAPRISGKLGFLEQTRSDLLATSPIWGDTGFLYPEALPFQRQPKLAASPSSQGVELPLPHEKKIIILRKPEPNLCGVKRKAPSPETDDLEISNTYLNKKPKEYCCVLCQVSTTSERGLHEHMNGKKHRAKAGSLSQKKELCGTAEESTSEIGVTMHFSVDEKSSESVHVESVEAEEQKDLQNLNNQTDPWRIKELRGSKFWCEICQIGTMSDKVMSDHRAGKKHLTKLRETVADGQESFVNLSRVSKKDDDNVGLVARKLGFGIVPRVKSCNMGSEKSNDTTGSTCDPGLSKNKTADGEAKDVSSDTSGPRAALRQAEEVSAIFMSAHEGKKRENSAENVVNVAARKEGENVDLGENGATPRDWFWEKLSFSPPGLCQVGEVSAIFMSAHDGGMK